MPPLAQCLIVRRSTISAQHDLVQHVPGEFFGTSADPVVGRGPRLGVLPVPVRPPHWIVEEAVSLVAQYALHSQCYSTIHHCMEPTRSYDARLERVHVEISNHNCASVTDQIFRCLDHPRKRRSG